MLDESMYKHMWTLTFRHGMNSTRSLNFYYKGDPVQAQVRARRYCAIMSYKYNGVEPFMIDLEKEEQAFLSPRRPGLPASLESLSQGLGQAELNKNEKIST